MAVQIAGSTPWARRYLTPEDRAAIAAMVPDGIVLVSLAAERRPGDWSARLYGPIRHADPLGSARHRLTLIGAVGAAIYDMKLGAPLAWCSACPDPAIYQRAGEAWCADHEATRGRTFPAPTKEVQMGQQLRSDQVRQGDVLLTRTAAAAGKAQPRSGRLVVQVGEATGHAHAIAEPTARLLTADEDRRFLRIVGAAVITHEEHGPIAMPVVPADYDVTIHEEWTDAMEPRQVLD
jgi:hypothetical protein